MCQFYYVGDFKSVDDKDKDVCAIEHEWAHDLARSYTNADNIKAEMAKRFPMEVWQDIADDYDLPVSLIGYIAKHILTSRHKTPNALVKYLKDHYYMRMEQAAKKKEEKEQKKQFMAIMHWKLGLGDLNKVFSGESPLPNKSKTATADDWKIEPMPDDPKEVTNMPFDFKIPPKPDGREIFSICLFRSFAAVRLRPLPPRSEKRAAAPLAHPAFRRGAPPPCAKGRAARASG